MKQKIFNLDSSKAFTPILTPKGQRPDIFRDILPLLPKPEFILCHRFKGKEHLSGHYGRKDFKYGNIKRILPLSSTPTTKQRSPSTKEKAPFCSWRTTLGTTLPLPNITNYFP
jgi:hypothetical protein